MSVRNPRKTVQIRRRLRRASTEAEALFWKSVRGKKILGLKFRRQYGIENYILDFYIPSLRIAVEIDGGVHQIESVKEKDLNKDTFLKENGIEVIRFTNDEVLDDLSTSMQKLENILFEIRPHLSSPSQGEELLLIDPNYLESGARE